MQSQKEKTKKRHAELVSASNQRGVISVELGFGKTLKQVQGDGFVQGDGVCHSEEAQSADLGI